MGASSAKKRVNLHPRKWRTYKLVTSEKLQHVLGTTTIGRYKKQTLPVCPGVDMGALLQL